MKLSRKIVGLIFIFLGSIASSFSFESGVGFHPPIKAAINCTNSYSVGNPSVSNPLIFQGAKQSPIQSPVKVYPTFHESAVDYMDPSDTFSSNVSCKPVIQDHTIYVCSGVSFQYKVLNGDVHYVPDDTAYAWSIVPGQSYNILGANSQPGNYQQSFTGTLPDKTLTNTNSSGQREQIIYSVTPRGPGSLGCTGTTLGTAFKLTVIVEPSSNLVFDNKPLNPICAGESFIVTPTTVGGGSVPADTKYIWTVTSNSNGATAVTTPQSSISQLLTNTTDQTQTVTYTVTPRLGNNWSCSGGQPFTVSVQVNPKAAITTQPVANTVCLNGTTPLSVGYTGGTGTPTYQWFRNTTNSNTSGGVAIANATSATFTPPTATVGILYYYVQLTFGTGGCPPVTSNPTKIEAVSLPSVVTQPEPFRSICVGGEVPAFSVAYTGGTGTATYQWFRNTTNSNTGGILITGATSDSYTPPASTFTTVGDYYYYAVITLSGSGCNTATSNLARVQVVADPVIGNQPLTSQIQCQGATPTNLSVTLSGGLGTAASYQWYSNSANSNTTGNLITGATSSSYTPPTTAIGTTYYYVEVTQDISSCKVISTTASVQIVASPTVSTQPTDATICQNGNTPPLSVTYSGGTGTPTYQWFRNTTNSNTSGGVAIANATSATFAPPTATVGILYYYVQLSFATGGCTTITSNPAKIEVVGITLNEVVTKRKNILCFGEATGNISVEGTGGTKPYTFKVTGTDYTGAAVSLTSGPTNDASFSFTILKEGTYFVNLTDKNGCQNNTLGITLKQPLAPLQITNDTSKSITCFGKKDGSISPSVSGGTAPYRYAWTGPNGFTSTSPNLSNLAVGSYSLIVTDAANCRLTKTYEMRGPDPIAITATISDYIGFQISCKGGSDGVIDLNITGGNGGYQIFWEGPGGFRSNLSKIDGLLPGKYEVTVIDSKNCTLKQEYTLLAPDEFLISSDDIKVTDVSCYNGSNGAIAVTIKKATLAPYRYELSGNSATGLPVSKSIQSDTLSYQFTGLRAGSYTLRVSDAVGCTVSVNATINETAIFDLAETIKNVSCFGEKDGAISVSVIGGLPPFKVQWAHGPQVPNLNNLDKGVYSVIITDTGGCSIEKQFVITEPQALDLSASVTDALDCEDQNTGAISVNPFGGTPPYTYTWSNGSNTQNLSAVGPGSYSLELVDANGCLILRQFTVNRPLPLEASVAQTTVRVCDPRGLKSNFKVTVKGGIAPYTVTWNRGTQTNAGLVMDTQELGEFIVTVKDARGCIQVKRIEVLETDPLIPEFDYTSGSFDLLKENLVNFEVQFKNLSVGKYNKLSWDFGDSGTSTAPDPTHKYVKAGTYIIQLRLRDLSGCIVSFSKEIVITDYYLKLPTAFTPNKDGVNDYFYPKFLHISAIHVFVVNKFGEILYESKDLEAKGWDGLYKGEKATIGNYVCRVRHTTLDGRVIDRSSVFYLGR